MGTRKASVLLGHYEVRVSSKEFRIRLRGGSRCGSNSPSLKKSDSVHWFEWGDSLAIEFEVWCSLIGPIIFKEHAPELQTLIFIFPLKYYKKCSNWKPLSLQEGDSSQFWTKLRPSDSPKMEVSPQEKTAKVNLVPPVTDLTLRFLDGGDGKFLWLENLNAINLADPLSRMRLILNSTHL